MIEEEFAQTVKIIVESKLPNEEKEKQIVEFALRMAKSRENKIMNELTIRFNEAINEKY